MAKKPTATVAQKPTVVAGDVCVDWFAFEDKSSRDNNAPLNWQRDPGVEMCARAGGALLLADLVKAATDSQPTTHRLTNLEKISPARVIHSTLELQKYPLDPKNEKAGHVYRVANPRGFSGPNTGIAPPLPVYKDDPDAKLVILDDAGNGFRDKRRVWPAALKTNGKQPLVLYKMNPPLFAGQLWHHLRQRHLERMVVVLSANSLRANDIDLSRRLSWERTATDFVWQMACNANLISLTNCAHVIVTFGLDGAIHYTHHSDKDEAHLYYDPLVIEDGFSDACPGKMPGCMYAFMATLATQMLHGGLATVGQGIPAGIRNARQLLWQGFGDAPHARKDIGKELFAPREKPAPIETILIPVPTTPYSTDPDFWCILADLNGLRLPEIAVQYVRTGAAKELSRVPVGSFGDFKTADRAEIESLRSIRNLMDRYLAVPQPKRPLSIAVFGPPGAGKSFGVTEVAKSIASGSVERREFNLAQFISVGDLSSALHQVRDIVLADKTPLIFWDEFDAEFGPPLGWLKYFLAPMQDGKFKDGETMHPLGKAIFVFAGGTSATFEKFCGEGLESKAKEDFEQAFRAAKGPDFVSRLRGYVNVLGPNPVREKEPFFIIRRAMMLRSMLERKAKDKEVHIMNQNGEAQLDDGVLRALLKVPQYHHGARSMEAIIDMSLLAGRRKLRKFEASALPPKEQLKLHVEAEMFLRLVACEVLPDDVRESLAQQIHERYRKNQEPEKAAHDRAMRPWEGLDEDLKESNRQQADDIPAKLQAINCGFAKVKGRSKKLFPFTEEEIAKLAEMEHARWIAEKRLAGLRYGKERTKTTSPYLVPWKELPEHVKAWDRDAVQAIPDILAQAGYEIYRL